MQDDELNDVDDAIPDGWLEQDPADLMPPGMEARDDSTADAAEGDEEADTASTLPPVASTEAVQAEQTETPAQTPPARYNPVIGQIWGEADDAALDAAMESMDPRQMREAIKGVMAKTYQTAIQHAALLNGGSDPIEDRVRHNMSIMAAQNPNALSDPKAREMAEFAAVQQYAAETGTPTHIAMMDYWNRKNGTPAQPVKPTGTTPVPAQRQAARQLPPQMRTPTPGVAGGTAPRSQPRTSSDRAATILSRELDMDLDADFFKEIDDSNRRATLASRRR